MDLPNSMVWIFPESMDLPDISRRMEMYNHEKSKSVLLPIKVIYTISIVWTFNFFPVQGKLELIINSRLSKIPKIWNI